jgi:tRNA threonylcarbamoyl adenosine modification protein (Sua5/YciO/YrdC/YwlC family)
MPAPGGVPVASPCRSRPYHSKQSINLIKAFSAVAWRQVAGKQRHRVSRSSSFGAMTTLATLDAAVQRHVDIINTEILHVDPGSFPWQDAGALSAIESDSLAPVNLAANPPTPMYTSDLSHLRRAAELLQQEEVVAIPTETVYGLAANALSASAVRKIFAAKQRPSDNPLIIHISSLDMLRALYPDGSPIPPIYTPILARHWPGPLTILLPRSPLVPEAVTCGQPTMAVRLPSHPVARTLIALCGFPLAAPSANSSGRPSPTLAHHVLEDLKGRLPLIIDGGACSSGLESTVLDALRQPPAILRPGGVTYEQLQQQEGLAGLQVYRRDFVDSQLEAAPSTPGMKYRHYSPDAKVGARAGAAHAACQHVCLAPEGVVQPALGSACSSAALRMMMLLLHG